MTIPDAGLGGEMVSFVASACRTLFPGGPTLFPYHVRLHILTKAKASDCPRSESEFEFLPFIEPAPFVPARALTPLAFHRAREHRPDLRYHDRSSKHGRLPRRLHCHQPHGGFTCLSPASCPPSYFNIFHRVSVPDTFLPVVFFSRPSVKPSRIFFFGAPSFFLLPF